MDYLIYASTTIKTMTEPELLDILTTSRENNAARNITGILLHSGNTFIQMLEGARDDVECTYAMILKDARHTNITKLIYGPAVARSFPNWTMGFSSINADLLKVLRGYFDLKHAFLEGTHPGLLMIKSFTTTSSM